MLAAFWPWRRRRAGGNLLAFLACLQNRQGTQDCFSTMTCLLPSLSLFLPIFSPSPLSLPSLSLSLPHHARLCSPSFMPSLHACIPLFFILHFDAGPGGFGILVLQFWHGWVGVHAATPFLSLPPSPTSPLTAVWWTEEEDSHLPTATASLPFFLTHAAFSHTTICRSGWVYTIAAAYSLLPCHTPPLLLPLPFPFAFHLLTRSFPCLYLQHLSLPEKENCCICLICCCLPPRLLCSLLTGGGQGDGLLLLPYTAHTPDGDGRWWWGWAFVCFTPSLSPFPLTSLPSSLLPIHKYTFPSLPFGEEET